MQMGSAHLKSARELVCARVSSGSFPVCGHIGLTPQSVNKFGGFKVQGKDEIQKKELIETKEKLNDVESQKSHLETILSAHTGTWLKDVQVGTKLDAKDSYDVIILAMILQNFQESMRSDDSADVFYQSFAH